MASRSSVADQDGVQWDVASLRLGTVGLDLRQQADPRSLTELLNARFLDERNVQRRYGHTGLQLVDSSTYPNAHGNSITPTGWMYGHGQTLAANPTTGINQESHVPVAGRGAATFNYGGADIAWTGDRLLIPRTDGNPALGGSTQWRRDNLLATSGALPQGIPAYLPLQTDSTPPQAISGSLIEVCLTPTLQVIIASGNNVVTGWIVDRGTGAVINTSTLSSTGSANPTDLHVVNSGGVPIALWIDSGSNLMESAWTGVAWTTPVQIATSVAALDVAAVPGGFHMVWRVGGVLYIGRYFGLISQNTPYAFATALPMGGLTAGGACTLAVAPNGELRVVFYATSSGSPHGMWARAFTAAADGTNSSWHQILTNYPQSFSAFDPGPFDAGLTVASRALTDVSGVYRIVIYAGVDGGGMHAYEVRLPVNETLGTFGQTCDDHRYNVALASRAFAVGDETFCWMRSLLGNTEFLVGGVHPQVCGYADREVALQRQGFGQTYQQLSQVAADPNSPTGTAFVWARPFMTTLPNSTVAQAYARAGNALIGTMEFLPQVSITQYGKSVYFSGSAVRNFDGITLGDAGFQDYPVVYNSNILSTGGSLTANGLYQWRVYAVMYNAQGERFQSAALTYPVYPATIAASATGTGSVALNIYSLPSCNSTSVQYEIYRTVAGGSTFYLDGVVANNTAVSYVSFTSTQSDTALISQPADPFATGVGNVSEIENWGPIGCSMLTVIGDRMWGAGGQVPPGQVQFSKLKENGCGAGFDDLAGTQEIDTQSQAITLIIGWAETVIAHQPNSIYVLSGSGPDNYGSGSFGVPQLVLADGAVTNVGAGVTQNGVLYWGVDGPRLLNASFQVMNISAPVRPLTSTLTPTGVQIDLSRQEAVWYTAGGTAVLWNWLSGTSRWAEWTGLEIAGCSQTALITPDGWLLYESATAAGDNGVSYAFSGCTAELSHDNVLGGSTQLRSVGIVGVYQGDHQLRLRVYYNGSPMWTDEWTWEPDVGTWLASATDLGALTPGQIDAAQPGDKSGQYVTHKRVSRIDCRTFRIEWSDVNATGQTFTPYELSLEMGARGGFGRVPVSTFGS